MNLLIPRWKYILPGLAAPILVMLLVDGFAKKKPSGVAASNLRAFLTMIQYAEGTYGPNAYRMLYGGDLFSSFVDHPAIPVTKAGLTSTAAGAYQILYRTWTGLQQTIPLNDFSPANQDRAAIELIRRRGALEDVMAGRFAVAVEKVPQRMGFFTRSWLWTTRKRHKSSNSSVPFCGRKHDYLILKTRPMNPEKKIVNMAATVKKRFDLNIAGADTTVSQIFELDKTIAFVKGVLLTSNRDDLMYYRGSAKIEVNRQEVFPEGYECKLLQSGINCPVNERYFDTGNLPIGNGQVKLTYNDVTDARAAFEPYRISIYLDCELKEY